MTASSSCTVRARAGPLVVKRPSPHQTLTTRWITFANGSGAGTRRICTKLVIPNSQIRYQEIEGAGPDDDARRAQILAALEATTTAQGG